jgi:hypothetical protein
MPDPAQQLAHIYAAGFEIETFDRYPRHIGVVRHGCIALLEVTNQGLKLTGTPGWRMGEVMGVLVEEGQQRIFRAKSEVLEATAERLEILSRFAEELEDLLTRADEPPGAA